MKSLNPKKLSDGELWWIIQNVITKKDGCPIELKKWYKKVEKEFYERDLKLHFII